MNITIEETGAYSYALNIEASAEDLEDEIEQALRDCQRKVQLDGFRRGRVPMPLVRKLYAEEIAEEVTDNLVVDIFQDFVEKSPKYDLWDDSEEFGLDYRYGADLRARIPFAVWPEIAIRDFAGERIEVPAWESTPVMVDDALEELLWNYGTRTVLEPGATVEDRDLITYETQRTDLDDAQQAATWKSGEQVLVLGREEDPLDEALRQSVIGAAVGDVVRYSVRDINPGDQLGPEASMHFEAVITSAERITPAELTADLVQRVLPAENCTVADLRDWVSLMVDVRVSRVQTAEVEERMRGRLLDLHEVVAPQLVVRQRVRELLNLEGGPLTEDYDLEGRVPSLAPYLLSSAERDVRWLILRQALLDAFEEELEPVDGRELREFSSYVLAMDRTFDNSGFEADESDAGFLEDPGDVRERAEDQSLFKLLTNKFDVVLVAEDGRRMPFGANADGEAA